MSAYWKPPDRRQFIWPAAGVLLGAVASVNPIYQPYVTLSVGIAVWFAAMALAVFLSAHPIAARLGTLLIGLSLAVPCFLRGTPLARGLLMCLMAFPLAIVASSLLAPPAANFRERLAYVFTWLGTREVRRRSHSLDKSSLLHLAVAAAVAVAAMASVKGVSAEGPWLLVRWLAGGIMVFATAEMITAGHNLVTSLLGVTAPALMRSPCLSTSVAEFWTRRWNPAASVLLFRTFFFTPLARRGAVPALCVAFFASALGHVLLPYMAMGRWRISLACGAFFLVQPLLILAERQMNVRRWTPVAARVWTLSALAIISPLFVEPALQLIEPSWGEPDNLLLPAIAILAFALGANLLFALGSLAARPALTFSSTKPALTPQVP
jgi:hypothetical protein